MAPPLFVLLLFLGTAATASPAWMPEWRRATATRRVYLQAIAQLHSRPSDDINAYPGFNNAVKAILPAAYGYNSSYLAGGAASFWLAGESGNFAIFVPRAATNVSSIVRDALMQLERFLVQVQIHLAIDLGMPCGGRPGFWHAAFDRYKTPIYVLHPGEPGGGGVLGGHALLPNGPWNYYVTAYNLNVGGLYHEMFHIVQLMVPYFRSGTDVGWGLLSEATADMVRLLLIPTEYSPDIFYVFLLMWFDGTDISTQGYYSTSMFAWLAAEHGTGLVGRWLCSDAMKTVPKWSLMTNLTAQEMFVGFLRQHFTMEYLVRLRPGLVSRWDGLQHFSRMQLYENGPANAARPTSLSGQGPWYHLDAMRRRGLPDTTPWPLSPTLQWNGNRVIDVIAAIQKMAGNGTRQVRFRFEGGQPDDYMLFFCHAVPGRPVFERTLVGREVPGFWAVVSPSEGGRAYAAFGAVSRASDPDIGLHVGPGVDVYVGFF